MRIFRAVDEYSKFTSAGGDNDPSLDFLATHPNPPQRLELLEQHAREIGPPGTGRRDRDSFLDGIDGMLYGDPPDEGYVRGRTFLHPRLGISFTVPEGFVIDNTASQVTATGPGDLAVRFDAVALEPKVSLLDYARSGWVAGLDAASIRPTTVNGLEAATARAKADNWQFAISLIRAGGLVYRLLTAAPVGSDQLEPTAGAVTASFHTLTEAQRAALKPLRIRLVEVQPGDTVGTLAARMVGVDRKLELFRLINGLGPGATVSAGDRIKIVSDQ